MNLQPLIKDATHCRLASAELVDQFNQLVAHFKNVRDTLPEVASSDDFRNYGKHLDQSPDGSPPSLRDICERSHYRVGFIGPSQIGKSTTFNNVLGINKSRLGAEQYAKLSPASEGAGSATTASITRLKAAETNTVDVHYLTEDMHKKRFDSLISEALADSNVEHLTLNDAIEALETRIAERDEQPPDDTLAGIDEQDGIPENTKDDLVMALKYLQSHQLHSEMLGTVKRDIPWDDRKAYINHEEGQPPSAKWLQRHVEIGFASKMISPELEMIDLPGLGSSAWDNMLTQEFLPDLDAALVFVIASQNVNTLDFKEYMSRLKAHFKNKLEGRVWVIVFHIEEMSEVKIHGDENGNTIMDSLHESISDKDVPLEQVLFISNNWLANYMVENSDPPTAEIPQDKFTARPWNFPLNDAGKLQPPQPWKKHQKLWDAFLPVTQDGGIKALRTLMQNTIAEAVKANVQKTARERIRGIAQRLRDLVTLSKDKAGMSVQEMLAAQQSATVMSQLADKIFWHDQYYLAPAQTLIDKLIHEFDRIFPPDYARAIGTLHEDHTLCIMPLAALAETGTTERLLPALYQHAKDYLSAELPGEGSGIKVPIRVEKTDLSPTKLGALDAWDQFQRYDVMQGRIPTKSIDQLRNTELFSSHDQYSTFSSIQDYRDFMHRRLTVLVQSICYATTLQMKDRLEQLRRGLRFLGQEDNPGRKNTTDIRQFDSVIEALDDFLNGL